MLTLAAAACGIFLLLVLAQLTGHGGAIVEPLENGWRLMLLQSLATGIGYAFFFRLQQVGGPVYLSQISYVNTAVGVAFAVLLFGERLNAWIWLAVALVFAGVALVNRTYATAREQVSRPRQTELLLTRRKFDQYRHLEYAIHYVDRNWAGHGDDFARGMGS